MMLRCTQQTTGITRKKGREHFCVIDVQGRPVGSGHMHHRLDGFGYVPGRFEHVKQSVHARRAGERQVELTREPVVLA